jgi:predicted TIM-barrel fold metal-dependent hydrolase
MGNYARKIDMHVHYLPKAYREGLLTRGEKDPYGYPTPAWNPEAHMEFMEEMGIATAMLSVSSPHLHFSDDHAAKILARQANDEGADVMRKYPNRFGLLASLPLPNIEDSLEEIQYVMDILHVDGFSLPTNTQKIYLGNPCLDPIFAELNRRRAVVVIHPNKPSCVPEGVTENLPIPMMEFFFDTTRTITNMILKGTINRFPEIKIVVPHAGAFLSILADRINIPLQMQMIGNLKESIDVYALLKGMYYDVAGACLPRQLHALMEIVDVDHLLYGSDYPYTPPFGCLYLAEALNKTDLLTDEQRRVIYRDNAKGLFPRLQTIK